MLHDWILSKLETIKDFNHVLVRDPLHILSEVDGTIHTFARTNGFTVVVAATNLVFRELYERVTSDPETKKLLVIDRAPARRRSSPSVMKAPPPFYPDLLANTSVEARIDIDLRQFLIDKTGDRDWPWEVNEPLYARLIVSHLEAVLRAYQNLRTAHERRFTDADFKTIVAFASLGVADAAFKKLDAQDYWKIGLLAHEALEELESLTPETTTPIRKELINAPAPFCFFANHDAETVVRAFYVSLILSQHTENWKLLLANIDTALAPLSNFDAEILRQSAPKLILLNHEQAQKDIESAERSLTKDNVQFLLIDQLKINSPSGFRTIIEKERYSIFIKSLSLVMALDNLISHSPANDEQSKVCSVLFPEYNPREVYFVDTRPSTTWFQLKEAYNLAYKIMLLRDELGNAIKNLKVLKTPQISFKYFQELWNEKKINRIEYYLSSLQRLIESGNLLPRREDELPSVFGNALSRIKQRLRTLEEDIYRQLDEINKRFQEFIELHYPAWITKDSDVCLTSQFLRKCLKPYWDPQNEKAVVFIFDGMRYDIWDELLRPMLEDRMETLADIPALSLLPSETHISRKAICAGNYPDSFDSGIGEDKLLKNSLKGEFGFAGDVEVVSPETTGTGETIRYRAGNLEVYIFEICDKGLHKIDMKTLPDGRKVPARPLAFIYQQHIKNIIDTEVMAIMRTLALGSKVFITADHGFGRVGREPLWFGEKDFNELSDCDYVNCKLSVSIDKADIPAKVRNNIVSFTPQQLRMPAKESRMIKKTGQTFHKEYKAIVFPKVGHSFSRPGSHFNPDAYTHGGISIQEMLIPMVVMRVKSREEGLLLLDRIIGPEEIIEGEEVEFRIRIARTASAQDARQDGELRVDIEASYGRDSHQHPLPGQVSYITAKSSKEVVFRFCPDTSGVAEHERREGVVICTLTITASYHEGHRIVRKTQAHRFTVRLNSEKVIRRVPDKLGKILGLTPKTMK